jgi:hypothetical protein
MKTIKSLILIIVLATSIACDNQTDLEIDPIFSEDSDKRLMTFALNGDNQFYFVSQEIDKETEVSMYSSHLPMKYNLFRQIDTNSNFELIDDDFLYTEDIKFDSNNKMLIRNHRGIYQINDNEYLKLLDEPINASDIDSKDIIWAGGYNSGLIRIDANGEITKYTDSTSILPTNGVNYIFIDKFDVIWIALWNNQGILKIDKQDWQLFNSTNSNLTSQNILVINSDKDNNMWIGTGRDDNSLSVMRFNGTGWENMSPNIGNEIINGTIRKIVRLGNKIYVVSKQYNLDSFHTNQLLEYDGQKWKKINLFPDNETIIDL